MKSRSILNSNKLWQNHEARILRVVCLALEMLRNEALPLPENENKINRKLHILLRRANRQLLALGQQFDWPLYYESRNQPDADQPERTARESKIPDFKWGICDHSEPDPDKSFKDYDIECKRLGVPTSRSPNWNLNQNYILNGVLRFIKAEYGYGKDTKSGAMIGYIQSMDMSQILIEVNAHAKGHSLPEIKLDKSGWKEKGVSKLNHQLDRSEVPLTPFDLRHLWIDLR